MALSCGIIGLPMVGKTTFFNLLTNAGASTSAFFSGKTNTNTGHATIPDERLVYLSKMFKPKKTTYAQVEIIDVPGLSRGASQGQGAGNEFLTAVRNTDALAQIVRVFNNEDVLHIEQSIDPMRDIEIINTELLFADLQMIETRLNRINSGHKKKLEHPLEEEALNKCREWLEEERPLMSLSLNEEETEALRHITFLTNKPMMIVLNLDEEQLASGEYPQKAELAAYCAEHGYELLTVSAKLFMEKGYEHTTLQDIIDDLGGLTKGAIYHHFKGKEEILLAIADRMGEQTEAWMQAIRDDPGLTGAEKLRRMFRASLGNSDQTDLFALAPNMLKNPKLMAILLTSMMEDVLPNYMEPVLREAVADGSIRTDYPEELGELLLLLSNVWLNPMIYPATGKDPPPHGALCSAAAEHGPGSAGSGAAGSVGAILPPVPGAALNNRRNCPMGQLLFTIYTYRLNV